MGSAPESIGAASQVLRDWQGLIGGRASGSSLPKSGRRGGLVRFTGCKKARKSAFVRFDGGGKVSGQFLISTAQFFGRLPESVYEFAQAATGSASKIMLCFQVPGTVLATQNDSATPMTGGSVAHLSASYLCR